MSNNELNHGKDALRRIANQLDVVCQTSGTAQASQAATAPENKRCESYPRLLYESLEIRGKANDISRKQETVSTLRETNAIESKRKYVTTTQHKKHIKNLPNEKLTTQIAQARNMSIGEHRYCCVTFKI